MFHHISQNNLKLVELAQRLLWSVTHYRRDNSPPAVLEDAFRLEVHEKAKNLSASAKILPDGSTLVQLHKGHFCTRAYYMHWHKNVNGNFDNATGRIF